ncbi:HD domain-containing protein [Pedobacter aquatilis]|uniref:HD domain-containing protein n=1 Tax=Pedobacter aquatilis TaxID=351343 RepID=UPI00292D1AEE|nr:HD domain-containing protein [Pedobacter aquatilis]
MDEKQFILNQTAHFIKDIYTNQLPEGMYFHNYAHTQLVVEAVRLISENENCSTDEKFSLHLSAMLHDIGYTEKYIGHEELGAKMAADFLIKLKIDEGVIAEIQRCIMATTYPQDPKSAIERIICDADFYHFSLKEYLNYASLLKKEWEQKLNMFFSNQEWDSLNLKLLLEHEYFTEYGKTILQKRKMINIEKLMLRLGQEFLGLG